jgi:hypothetical protein
MAISRSQLVKELEPGLNALFGWNIKGMKISMLRFILQSHLTELLKKKLCYLALQTHK